MLAKGADETVEENNESWTMIPKGHRDNEDNDDENGKSEDMCAWGMQKEDDLHILKSVEERP